MNAPSAAVPPEVVDQARRLLEQAGDFQRRAADLAAAVGLQPEAPTRLSIIHGYIGVFAIAFLVTLAATPLLRRLAIANGIIDHPTDPRKVHRMPVAYLGGVAVFLGLMAGVFYSYLGASEFAQRVPWLLQFHGPPVEDGGQVHAPVPVSIVLGMFLIMMVGLLDDVLKISPRIKVAGQLIAAAALAVEYVGVRVAEGVLVPLAKTLDIPKVQVPGGGEILGFLIPLPAAIPGVGDAIPVDVVYWTGTAIIAAFVLGGCNASNLIDGLDGLLGGVTAVAAMGLLFLALSLALANDGPRDAQRIVLCMALLGACLGFLPHNFNPATIFLGDSGSLLLGYCTVVVILTLGDTGQTHLVFAGLVIYAIPIIDTVLAIVRRKMAGLSISAADDQHLHHMLKRALGVKGAVFTLYAIGAGFAVLGVALSLGSRKIIYALVLVFAAYIGVTAFKIARRRQLEQDVLRLAPPAPLGPPGPAAAARPEPPAPPHRAPRPEQAAVP